MASSKRSLRWHQFSITTLLWLMTVGATTSYGVRERLERLRLQDELSESQKNSVTIGLSAPSVFTADLDIPYSQDDFTIAPVPNGR
ncbi:MAG TPA: hypothetical protein VGJ26_21070 [Pirellulales bacterium]|jgi:hypothetical protein